MEGINANRKPFQGVANIVRFNWHYYVLACITIVFLLLVAPFLPYYAGIFAQIVAALVVLSTFVSLAVSYYIYDYSDIYKLYFLNNLPITQQTQLLNINAGFDETSALIKQKYPTAHLTVFDFYKPDKHTEVSIERARKAYPAFADTLTISTDKVPLAAKSVDYILLILAAHEIRNHSERAAFFEQLNRALRPNGRIIVVEHQRDIANFIAFNFGFLHFFSPNTWKQTFNQAQLSIVSETKITPFISTYILQKNGTTP